MDGAEDPFDCLAFTFGDSQKSELFRVSDFPDCLCPSFSVQDRCLLYTLGPEDR